MVQATKIVEAEIGPQSDVGAFVSGALQTDFMLNRFALDTSTKVYPAVYDTKTGIILCYLTTEWLGGPEAEPNFEWGISGGDTFRHMKHVLKRDPGYANGELQMMRAGRFHSWRRAVEFLLKFPATQAFVNEVMGITETSARYVNALGYETRLEALTQSLAQLGFYAEKIDRRAGKGTSCYVLGKGPTTEAVVVETLRGAAGAVGLAVDNPQAARRNETTWQIDFKVPNLFEAEDMDQFVTTAFREQVPGHAEMERVTAFRDALRRNGLPVYKLDVAPVWGGEISYTVYFDNRSLNLSRTKTAEIVDKSLTGLDRLNKTMNSWGHGAARHIEVRLKAIKPESFKHYTVESEFDEFAEIAAARQGTIGDELRLKRLVNHLKTFGFKIKEASLAQYTTIYLMSVQYKIELLSDALWRGRKLSLSDAIAREQIKELVTMFLQGDKEISGAPLPSEQDICVIGGHRSLFTVSIQAPSLRKTTTAYEKTDSVKLQLEGIEDEMADVAIQGVPGLRTRMWLKKLRASLESKGLVVRELRATQWAYKLRMLAHINAADASVEPDYKIFAPTDVIAKWYQSVKDTGSQVIIDAGDETVIKADQPDHPHVYSIRGFVQSTEPFSSWPEGAHITEATVSLDDMGIEEHERLWLLGNTMEKMYYTNSAMNPVDVLWLKAHPALEENGFPPGTVYVSVRCIVTSRPDAIYSFDTALSAIGAKRASCEGISNFGGLRIRRVSALLMCVDMYACLEPAGAPLIQPVECRGPSSHKWPAFVDTPVSETFDPEDEVWVRQVVSATPGFKDLERLKASMRALEAAGFEITGATQQPHNPGNTDTVCSVMIAVKRTPQDFGTTPITRESQRIAAALKPFDLLDLRYQYDTTDNEQRVWQWFWLSHDSPPYRVPLHLRKGSWNEYLDSGLAALELDSFLVEQFDEPGEESDPYYQVFAGAQDVADPLWRERLRLQAMADDIAAHGYKGWLLIQCFDGNLSVPTLFLSFTNTDPQKMDTYSIRNLVQNLNLKHHFASPGNIWANASDLNRSFKTDTGQPEMRMSVPYMYINNAKKEGTLPKGRENVKIVIGEALEFTPREMAGFARVAAKPDKMQVVRQAWKAFLKAFQARYPGAGGYANFLQEPKPGGYAHFEFYLKFDEHDDAEYNAVRYSMAVTVAIEDYFRNVVLDAGLKRYKPRRTLYYHWPAVEVSVADDCVNVLCRFTLKNLIVPDKAEHISNVHQEIVEDEQDDIEQFVGQVIQKTDPGLPDKLRLQALAKDIEALPQVEAGVLNAQKGESTGARNPRYVTHIGIDILAKPEAIAAGNPAFIQTYADLCALLKKHGFGNFGKTGDLNGTIHVLDYLTAMNYLGHGQGWKFTATGADVSTAKFPKTRVVFGSRNIFEGEQEDIEALVGTTLGETDPAAEVIGRLQAVVRSLQRSHWDWIDSGQIEADSIACPPATITIQVTLAGKPNQNKPGQFVLRTVKDALRKQGFTWSDTFAPGVILRPIETGGWFITAREVIVDSQFRVTRFPKVVIDFDDKMNESEGIDPEEFVTGADEGTKWALFRNLKQIADSLKENGWLGYLNTRSWQGSGNTHELTIRMAKNDPNVSTDAAYGQVEKDVMKALKGFVSPYTTGPFNAPRIEFERQGIRGYQGEYPGFWHWMVNFVVDLNGHLPDEGGSNIVFTDIQTGGMEQLGLGRPLRGEIGPGEPA